MPRPRDWELRRNAVHGNPGMVAWCYITSGSCGEPSNNETQVIVDSHTIYEYMLKYESKAEKKTVVFVAACETLLRNMGGGAETAGLPQALFGGRRNGQPLIIGVTVAGPWKVAEGTTGRSHVSAMVLGNHYQCSVLYLYARQRF